MLRNIAVLLYIPAINKISTPQKAKEFNIPQGSVLLLSTFVKITFDS
jgi:hypothetical protein